MRKSFWKHSVELSCGRGHDSDKGKAIGKTKTLFKAKPIDPALQS